MKYYHQILPSKLFLIIINLLVIFINCDNDNELFIEEQTAKPILKAYLKVDSDILIDDEISCKIIFVDEKDSLNATGKIARRGGASIVYDKHSYKIDLNGDYAIAGLAADDDWILNANHIDKSFMRHTISYELFKKMNLANNIATHWTYVEVYLNKAYKGLYVLMERLDRSSLMIEKPDTAAFIFKDPPIFRENWDAFIPQEPNNFHQQNYPAIEDLDKTKYINAVRNFILNADDNLFSEKIDTIFDIENIIDWHLLLLCSNNGDGILKNFYMYQQSQSSLIKIAPWDYDHSFGRYGDNTLNLDKPVRPERAILLNRLLQLEWYTKQLKQRWLFLNEQQILGIDGISAMVDEYSINLKPLVAKNFEVWSIDGFPFKDDNNFEDEIAVIKQYLQIRQAQLEDYFDTL